jgi:hypothetical protein
MWDRILTAMTAVIAMTAAALAFLAFQAAAAEWYVAPRARRIKRARGPGASGR